MFSNQQVLGLTGGTQTVELVNIDNQRSTRVGRDDGDLKVTFVIGTTATSENPLAGGSNRHLISCSNEVINAGSQVIGEARAQLTIVSPKGPLQLAKITRCVQALVSFLTAETGVAVSADAEVDQETLIKILNGEP